MLVSCAAQTADGTLPVKPPQFFSESGAAQVPDRWWTAFNNKSLNAQVDLALSNNFNLKTAWQRMQEAQAVVDRESASLFPHLDAFGEGEISRSVELDTDQLRIGLASDYEVDLWGQIRSSIEAEQYRTKATLADYQAAALTLSAEVVRTWYRAVAAQNRLAILEAQIDANEKVLELLKNRFSSGQTRSVDVLRQQQLLEATRQQRHAAIAEIRVLEHQLAVLAGQPPQNRVRYTGRQLPDLPPLPETGLPAELVRRRPDVQGAYERLKAADSDLAAAISRQYPRLTLTATLYTTDEGTSRLFEDWARSFAGELIAPLFDAGQRAAEVDRTEAIKYQRLYDYGQATLAAFQEVENALIREKKQNDLLKSLEDRVALSRKAYEQLRVEYLNGVSDFIDVLTALTEQQQLRRDLITEKLTLLEFRIALYRALAGGFETKRETEKRNQGDKSS